MRPSFFDALAKANLILLKSEIELLGVFRAKEIYIYLQCGIELWLLLNTALILRVRWWSAA